MIFSETYEWILSGKKTATSRPKKDGEKLDWQYLVNQPNTWRVDCVYGTSSRIKHYVGQVNAIQPGRGVAGVGFIKITGIREMKLHDLTSDDIRAEGCRGYRLDTGIENGDHEPWIEPEEEFQQIWDVLHGKTKNAYAKNPIVFVYSFVLCDKSGNSITPERAQMLAEGRGR